MYTGKINIYEADIDQNSYWMVWEILMIQSDQKQWKVKIKKQILIKAHKLFMKVENLNAFKSGIFSIIIFNYFFRIYLVSFTLSFN